MTGAATATAPAGLHFLWRTEWEVVVVKPAGLVCEAPRDAGADSLVRRVARALAIDRPRLVHRLDRPARGIVVVAACAEAAAAHSRQIASGAWRKWYVARVWHDASAGRSSRSLLGIHRAYLRTEGKRARLVRAGGKPAALEVVDLRPAPGRPGQAHVLVRLQTGRYHQLRAMLQGLGAPLVGDVLYGDVRDGSRVARSGGDRHRVTRSGGATRNGESMYLEHAALCCRPFGTDQPVTFHWRDDPEREPMAPELLERLVEVSAG